MLIVDDEDRCRDANPAACELFGQTRAQLTQLLVGDLLRTETATGSLRYVSPEKKECEKEIYTILREDGQKRIVEFGTVRLYREHHIVVLRDITQVRHMEVALAASEELAASFGVSDALFAASDADVAHACARALDVLVALGAERVKVDLPLCGHASAIGYLTFGGELLCMLREVMERRPGDIGADLLMSLRLLSHIPGDGYLDAQRLRAGLREELRGAFSSVDLLAMPTTGQAAPPLSEVERGGLIDLPALDALVRFTFIGNLSGLPALSAPVGVKASGGAELPLGLQLVGDAWDEATVLAAAGALERQGAAEVRRPPGAIDLLA